RSLYRPSPSTRLATVPKHSPDWWFATSKLGEWMLHNWGSWQPLRTALGQHGIDARSQFIVLEGLGQHVHAIAQETVPILNAIGIARHEKNGHGLPLLAGYLGQFTPVQPRQTNVGHNQVDPSISLDMGEGRPRILRLHD